MNYVEQINKIQKQIESSKIERAKLQEREQTLKEEKEKLLEELKSYDISVNDLESEIVKTNEEIEAELKKIEEILK